MDAPQPTAHAPNLVTAEKDDSSLPPPATHSPRRPHRCRRVAIACCAFVSAFLSTLLFSIMIPWLYLHPSPGTYALTDANLSRFTLTEDTANSSYSLDADVDLTLLFRNPNKETGFIVKGVTVQALLQSGDEIGAVAIAPFHQARRSETTMVARVRAVKRSLSQAAGGGLRAEIGRSDIAVRVEVRGRVRGADGWYAPLYRGGRVRLTCVVNMTAPRAGMNRTAVIGKRCGL